MGLLRDLCATSPRRTAILACLIVLSAAGQSVASALTGPVLLHRSIGLFILLAASLVIVVVGNLAVGLIAAGLTADWSADVRRRLCGVAFAQDLQTLESTPVGELLDRIDGDVYQVAADLRGTGVSIVASLATTVLSIVTALIIWWPAGLGMLALAMLMTACLNKPTRKISPARTLAEEAWSDLAAVMEEAVHGQDDIRTSLARPYVLRLYARQASAVLATGRTVWRLSSQVTATASGLTRIGIATVVCCGAWALVTGHVDAARLTSTWLLSLAFGGTIEHVSRIVPELQNALGAWTRVQLLCSAIPEPLGGREPLDADLVIRDLTFRYRAEEATATRPPALRQVNLTFTRGKSYALIGRTGSGKSTLAKVLTRSVDCPRGTVFLGGTTSSIWTSKSSAVG